MCKVKVKLGKPVMVQCGKMQACNSNVSIPVWHNGGMDSTDCHVVC